MARIKGSKKTGGRKKGTKNKDTIQKELFREFLFQEVMKEKKSLVKSLIKAGKEGNIQALKEIIERILGKVTESIDITSAGEKIIGFNYVKPSQRDNPNNKTNNKTRPRLATNKHR